MGALLDTQGLADLALGVVNRIWPDKSEQEKQAAAADLSLALAQSKVNAAEAATGDRFIAGWRPFIGWVCGSGLAYQFIVSPVMAWITTGLPQTIDTGQLTQLLIAMLGMGTLRTFEKHTNTERNR